MFDMDGTLIDSFMFHAKGFQRFLKQYKVDLDLETVGGMIGNTIKVIFDQTLPQETHDEALKDLTRFYMEDADDLIAAIKPVKKAGKTVRRIKAAGLYTALLTNSKEELVAKIVKAKRLKPLFDEIKGADDASLDKTDRCRAMIMRRGLKPEDVLYVGDTSHDILFAKKVGMDSCLILNNVSWIKHEKLDIKQLESNYVVDDIIKVMQII